MITTGVWGGQWRADVTAGGGLEPWRGGRAVHWHVAADDRWHSAETEGSVRQRRIGGTPVVETRLRIPQGDAIQRIWTVADHGGLTLIEIENASPLPIVVAFTHPGLLSARPGSTHIEGIELPEGTMAHPIGHRARLVVALPHGDVPPGASLPADLPTADGVARGWTVVADTAGRVLLPDAAWGERVVAERCELALGGPERPDLDAVGFVLGVDQLVRMGDSAHEWMPDVAAAVERAARHQTDDWAYGLALGRAAAVAIAAGDDRAATDLARLATRTVGRGAQRPDTPPLAGVRFLAWVESLLVAPGADGAALLPHGFPHDWLGQGLEAHRIPAGGDRTASFAIRWHGARPAVLWEQSGPGRLTAPAVAPSWSTTDASGEALWPEPAGAN